MGVGQGGISSGKCVLAAVGRALPRRSPRFSPQPPGARRLPPVRSPKPRGERGRRGPRLNNPGAVAEGVGLPPSIPEASLPEPPKVSGRTPDGSSAPSEPQTLAMVGRTREEGSGKRGAPGLP